MVEQKSVGAGQEEQYVPPTDLAGAENWNVLLEKYVPSNELEGADKWINNDQQTDEGYYAPFGDLFDDDFEAFEKWINLSAENNGWPIEEEEETEEEEKVDTVKWAELETNNNGWPPTADNEQPTAPEEATSDYSEDENLGKKAAAPVDSEGQMNGGQSDDLNDDVESNGN